MKLTCNRSRFVKNVEEHFQCLIQLLKNKPQYLSLLSDKGAGEAPVEFLAAVETGMRKYGDDKYCMGVGALRTPDRWSSVDLYRKREAYITVARFVKYNASSYRKWQSFLWTDFFVRHVLSVTFEARHAPLSDGQDHFQGKAWRPAHWAQDVPQLTAATAAAADSDANVVTMRFSPADGKLMPF